MLKIILDMVKIMKKGKVINMKFKLLFYNLRRGIHNVIRYLPVIWSEEDFSYEPIYKLLYYKLKFMEEFERSDCASSANALKTADEIKIAKNLAKRLNEDNYLCNALREHEKMYPDYLEKSMNFEKIEGKPLRKRIDLNCEEEKKSFSRACKLSDYLEEQDREYLFNYLKKYVKGWWD